MVNNEINDAIILTQSALTGATATSTAVRIGSVDNVGVQVNWTNGSGSPDGTCSVEASNDNITYAAMTLDATPTISGNSGSLLINVNQFPFSWLRLKVAMTTGQIDVSASLSAEQI